MSSVTTYNNAECFITLASETAFTVPSYNSRNVLTIKNASAAACTLTAAGSETIDGASTYSLDGYCAVKLVRGDTEWVAVAGYDALTDAVGSTKTAYGVGTVYSLTNTAAAVDLGTTDPAIVIDAAGTYLVMGQVNLTYTGATVVAETATLKVRRTNNTAADLSPVVVLDLPVSTTLTHSYGVVQIPPFIYTTTATDDAITIFGNVSAALGAGTIDVTAIGTSLVAVRIA